MVARWRIDIEQFEGRTSREKKESLWYHSCTPASISVPNVTASYFVAHQGHYWITNNEELRRSSMVCLFINMAPCWVPICAPIKSITNRVPVPSPSCAVGVLIVRAQDLREERGWGMSFSVNKRSLTFGPWMLEPSSWTLIYSWKDTQSSCRNDWNLHRGVTPSKDLFFQLNTVVTVSPLAPAWYAGCEPQWPYPSQ